MSGNPNGRPRLEVDIAALARAHGPKCIEVAYRLMMHDKDSKVRLAACVALLDRGFGKPKVEIEANGTSMIELHLVAARTVSQHLLDGSIEAEVINGHTEPANGQVDDLSGWPPAME